MKEQVEAIFPSRKRVLSVDDDPINQLVIQTCLEPEGYEVFQAMDGFEALKFLADEVSAGRKLPDAMLLDVMMPGMSGYEVCEEVRRLYGWRLPIVMISAKGKKEDVVMGLSKGCNDYVVKPFDKTELLCRIQTRIKLNILPEVRDSLLNKNSLLTKLGVGGNLNFPRVHVLCIKTANSVKSPNTISAQVTNLASDQSELLSFSQSLHELIAHADKILTNAPSCRAGISTGPLDTVLVESDRMIAYVGVGQTIGEAQDLAATALPSTIALSEETLKESISKVNKQYKVVCVSSSPKEDLAVPLSVAAAALEATRNLDYGRFIKEAERVTDDRISSVMRLVENKHSTRGDADESQVRANLKAALDAIEQTTDVNKISDLVVAVARSCSSLFSLGRTGAGANDPRVKERVEHLTQWLNQISGQFTEARKNAETVSPVLVSLEAEFAQIFRATEKLARLVAAEKELNLQAGLLSEQLEIASKEAEVIEAQVASAFAQLVRNTVVPAGNSRP